MDDLDAHFPAEVVIEAAGEQFTLSAFKAKNLRPYLAIHRRLQEKATRLGRDLAQARERMLAFVQAQASDPTTPQPDLGDISYYLAATPDLDVDKLPLELLHERCFEEYIDLVRTATGKSLAWVEELGIDDLVTIAGLVNELNARRYSPKKPSALEATATPQS